MEGCFLSLLLGQRALKEGLEGESGEWLNNKRDKCFIGLLRVKRRKRKCAKAKRSRPREKM